MTGVGTLAECWRRQGFCWLRGALGEAARQRVLQALMDGRNQRGLLALPEVAELAQRPALVHLAGRLLARPARAVKAIWFDKSPAHNWAVGWHRDQMVAVQALPAVLPSGFGPSSRKSGVWHVGAPFSVLQRIVTFRFHFDACDGTSGALLVVPGSHRPAEATPLEAERAAATVCEAGRGDLLVMSPLLWHASRKMTTPARRRILHIEFAAGELPGGLAWEPA